MKLIVQGSTVLLEVDGQTTRLPEGSYASFDDRHNDPDYDGENDTRVTLTFSMCSGNIITRPADAVQAMRADPLPRNSYREHLLLLEGPGFVLDGAKRPEVAGWTCTGGITIKGNLESTIPFVWVFKRTVEGPSPEPIAKLTGEDRKRLFSGIWTPESKGDLCFDLNLAFSPCEIRESP